MAITELTLRLLLLFCPGIITKLLLEKLTEGSDKRHFYFILYSFLFGLFAYALYAMISWLINSLPFWQINSHLTFLDSLLKPNSTINFNEIIWVSILAIINGYILSFIKNKKFLHKIAQSLGVTEKFAEVDVWSYILNSENDAKQWIRVRDHEKNLCYEGWIEAFSETFKENELFIRDVKVYLNNTGAHLYNVSGMYVTRPNDDITLEFYALDES
ncbi:hypothetical protein GF406_22770 [candidate division KSB1 bacterium]|nr:hypothetical protein [candidate division KSB1 bacterium]